MDRNSYGKLYPTKDYKNFKPERNSGDLNRMQLLRFMCIKISFFFYWFKFLMSKTHLKSYSHFVQFQNRHTRYRGGTAKLLKNSIIVIILILRFFEPQNCCKKSSQFKERFEQFLRHDLLKFHCLLLKKTVSLKKNKYETKKRKHLLSLFHDSDSNYSNTNEIQFCQRNWDTKISRPTKDKTNRREKTPCSSNKQLLKYWRRSITTCYIFRLIFLFVRMAARNTPTLMRIFWGLKNSMKCVT